METAYFEDDIYKASGKIQFVFDGHITQPHAIFTSGQLVNEKWGRGYAFLLTLFSLPALAQLMMTVPGA
jgi:hypothetical protein